MLDALFAREEFINEGKKFQLEKNIDIWKISQKNLLTINILRNASRVMQLVMLQPILQYLRPLERS